MKNTLFLLSCLTILGCSRTLTSLEYKGENTNKGIYYNLPKSIIKVDIPYTICKDYDLLNGSKVYTSNSYAIIENPVTVTSVAIPDEDNRYILAYKKNASNYFYEDNYTVEINPTGSIKSINWETENVIPDIATNIISSGLTIFKTITPAADDGALDEKLKLIEDLEKEITSLDKKIKEEVSKANLKEVKKLRDLQKIVISRVDYLKKQNKEDQKDKVTKSFTVYLNLEKDYSQNDFIDKKTDPKSQEISFAIDLKSKFKGIDEESFPKIIFTLPHLETTVNNYDGLKYRVPKKVDYQIKLAKGSGANQSKMLLISSDIDIIQYGDINSFPLKVKGSKKSKIAITVDEKTALITKVSNTSNSILKESSSVLKESAEEIYEALDNYAFNKKKRELENDKALLELEQSNEELKKEEKEQSDIEKKIAELKLLVQKLELENKLRELEEEGE